MGSTNSAFIQAEQSIKTATDAAEEAWQGARESYGDTLHNCDAAKAAAIRANEQHDQSSISAAVAARDKALHALDHAEVYRSNAWRAWMQCYALQAAATQRTNNKDAALKADLGAEGAATKVGIQLNEISAIRALISSAQNTIPDQHYIEHMFNAIECIYYQITVVDDLVHIDSAYTSAKAAINAANADGKAHFSGTSSFDVAVRGHIAILDAKLNALAVSVQTATTNLLKHNKQYATFDLMDGEIIIPAIPRFSALERWYVGGVRKNDSAPLYIQSLLGDETKASTTLADPATGGDSGEGLWQSGHVIYCDHGVNKISVSNVLRADNDGVAADVLLGVTGGYFGNASGGLQTTQLASAASAVVNNNLKFFMAQNASGSAEWAGAVAGNGALRQAALDTYVKQITAGLADDHWRSSHSADVSTHHTGNESKYNAVTALLAKLSSATTSLYLSQTATVADAAAIYLKAASIPATEVVDVTDRATNLTALDAVRLRSPHQHRCRVTRHRRRRVQHYSQCGQFHSGARCCHCR